MPLPTPSIFKKYVPAGTLADTVADSAHEAFKGILQFFGFAAIENDTELAAGITGYCVTCAHDPAQALAKLEQCAPGRRPK